MEATLTHDVTGHALRKEAWGSDGSLLFPRSLEFLNSLLGCSKAKPMGYFYDSSQN